MIILAFFIPFTAFSNPMLGPETGPLAVFSENSYEDYLNAHPMVRPDAEIAVGNGGVFTVGRGQGGYYNLELRYMPVSGTGSGDIEQRFSLDGSVPCRNVETVILPRLWKNEENLGRRFRTDPAGNEIRPKQIEINTHLTAFIKDSLHQYSGELLFYLAEGEHIVSLAPNVGLAEIQALTFKQAPAAVRYEDYLLKHRDKQDSAGVTGIYEAELAVTKNSNVLFPTYDKSRDSISPSHHRLTRYNTVGKDTWNTAGQALAYEINVRNDGFYTFAFKVKQSTKRGMFSTRAVYIDGELPYQELGRLRFDNNTSWYVQTPKDPDGAPYKVYLTRGRHLITIEAVLGDEEEVLREAERLVAEMNAWYRKIIVITGSNADSSRISIDLNRDFLLDMKIPGLIDGFASIVQGLDRCVQAANDVYGKTGNAGTVMAELSRLLKRFIDDPDRIPAGIETYYGSVSSMATWMLEMRAQPLEMDWFAVISPGVKPPKAAGSFFRQLAFRTMMFISSFGKNYSAVGTEGKADRSIDVWVSLSDIASGSVASGRDQANIIKLMTDDLFTAQTGIGVNLALINNSTVLMQAVLAGRGPDAALVVPKDVPVNLAMRGAAVALDGFDSFSRITGRFQPTAMVPYQFNGNSYALPETQSFDMLFYRKDVFAELGLTPPETWEDFYYVTSVLQQNNLLAGIPESRRMFETLLYQKGTSVYSDDLRRTTFDRPQALAAFEQWTGLYAKYGLPLVFDFFNRFRSGEMAMAIVPYTQSNYIAGAAPELKGLWGFTPVPATSGADNRLNRAVTAMGSACMMINKADTSKYDDAFAFLSWWTGEEAQSHFAMELENVLGASARYATANTAAFDNIPWLPEQSQVLKAQWDHVVEVPVIPGGYYIDRNIAFAFRAVVYNFANERETLYKYNKEINKEITRKREEFGLDQE
jgi:ABC-type glycerol-3-phosphate transport system substrate-binding protein